LLSSPSLPLRASERPAASGDGHITRMPGRFPADRHAKSDVDLLSP
jgi:hypothetical protein